jgi:accessory gene regulator protein AgrB
VKKKKKKKKKKRMMMMMMMMIHVFVLHVIMINQSATILGTSGTTKMKATPGA